MPILIIIKVNVFYTVLCMPDVTTREIATREIALKHSRLFDSLEGPGPGEKVSKGICCVGSTPG